MSRKRVSAAWWVGEAIADRESAFLAVTAGLGAGKTHGMCQWHHARCLENYNAEFSAFSEPIYQKIHDAAIPKYKRVLQDFGLQEGRDFKVYKSPFPKLVYKCLPKPHEVHFISADSPDMVVAVEYSHATQDESGAVSLEFTNNLGARIRDKRAPHRQFFQGGAPQGINAFADNFNSDEIQGWNTRHWRDHWVEQEVEGVLVRKRRFKVWTDDNQENLPQGYIQTYIVAPFGHNPNLIRSYRYGEFCPLTEGACYSNYMPQRHDVEPIEADPFRDILIWMDFNVAPLAWTAGQVLPFDEYGLNRKFKAVAIDEAQDGAQQLDDAAVEFAHKFPPSKYGNTTIALYGDRTGHAKSHKIAGSDFENFARYLAELGFRNVEIRASRQVAPEASSVDSLNKLFSKDLFLVSKKCRNLRRSLLATSWKKGTRKIDKPAGETWTHPSDGVKYWAWQEMREFNGSAPTKIMGTNG